MVSLLLSLKTWMNRWFEEDTRYRRYPRTTDDVRINLDNSADGSDDEADDPQNVALFVDKVWSQMIRYYRRDTFHSTDLLYGISPVVSRTGECVWWLSIDHPFSRLLQEHFRTHRGSIDEITCYTSNMGSFVIYNNEVIEECVESVRQMCLECGKTFLDKPEPQQVPPDDLKKEK